MNNILKYKRTVIAVGILIICGIYSYYVMIPQILEASRLKNEIKNLNAQYEVYKGYEKRVNAVDSEEKALIETVEVIRRTYPSNIAQNDIIGLLYKLSEATGVKFINVSIAEAKEIVKAQVPTNVTGINNPRTSLLADKLGLPTDNSKSTQNSGLAVIPNGSGYVIEVKLESSGTNEQYKSLFKTIDNFESKIEIRGYTATKENNLVRAVFSLEFLGIMDNSATFSGFGEGWTWEAVDFGNRTNIFEEYKNITKVTSINNSSAITASGKAKQVQAATYDFAMRVVPYGNNMAPATVSLSAKNLVNSKLEPLIYGDNLQTETINFYVKETNGKFFCKYKTEKQAFPEATYTELEQFKPVGRELTFLIDSTNRSFNGDNASALLKIYNNTSRKLVVRILNDDKTSPRIIVEQYQGDIKVEYN